MKTIQVNYAIDLCDKMINRYNNDTGILPQCPICKFFDDYSSDFKCFNCFNRVNYEGCSELFGCTEMQTFPKKREEKTIRTVYWNKLREYLTSVDFKDIPLNVLRNKCNEIDQKIL